MRYMNRPQTAITSTLAALESAVEDNLHDMTINVMLVQFAKRLGENNAVEKLSADLLANLTDLRRNQQQRADLTATINGSGMMSN